MRSLVRGSFYSVGLWLVSNLGALFAFVTYQVICGQLMYPLFYGLAFWPSILLWLFFGGGLPNTRGYQGSYPLACLESFVGWLILGNLVSLLWQVWRIYGPRLMDRVR